MSTAAKEYRAFLLTFAAVKEKASHIYITKLLPSILAICSISEIYDCFGIIYCLPIFLHITYNIYKQKSKIHRSNKSSSPISLLDLIQMILIKICCVFTIKTSPVTSPRQHLYFGRQNFIQNLTCSYWSMSLYRKYRRTHKTGHCCTSQPSTTHISPTERAECHVKPQFQTFIYNV